MFACGTVRSAVKCVLRSHSVVTTKFSALCSNEGNILVETESIGPVFLIGINRPTKRNCVNRATAQQLCDAVREFETDDELRVAVLYGKGGNFCAGYDLSELAAFDSADVPKDLPENGQGPMGPSRMMFSKPMIAAVAGYAAAGGLELACMCDLRIAEETAVFGVFSRRFGVPLLDGGTVRLPQLIGLSRALDLILTGRPVNASEALQMGLANRVCLTGAALGEATKLAQTLSSFPQECMLRDRLSAFNSCFNASSLTEALKFEWDNAKHVVSTESFQGAQQFVEGTGRKGSFHKDSKPKPEDAV